MADAIPLVPRKALLGNHRYRSVSQHIGVELIPSLRPDHWHMTLFRNGHVHATVQPKHIAMLPQLLRAVGLGLTDADGWKHRWCRPREHNPYHAVERLGHVYYIGAEGIPVVKIGTSINPSARLATLQTSSPVRLHIWATCTGGRELEHRLHRRFAAHRHHGEWFHAAPEVIAFMEQEVQDARQFYAIHAMPWQDGWEAREQAIREQLEAQAEETDSDVAWGFRSGSIIVADRHHEEEHLPLPRHRSR